MWTLENSLFERGVRSIAGIDEAGRGPLAGPVAAAAVIIPVGTKFCCRIDDSKKLSPHSREQAFQEITEKCLSAVALVNEKEIDRINIFQAALAAMARAVLSLDRCPDWLLVDGPWKPRVSLPCTCVIGGDSKSISIAAASILAKVTRDRLMIDYDREYPVYGFAKHKGYGTRFHCEALQKHGPCPIHRRSFAKVVE